MRRRPPGFPGLRHSRAKEPALDGARVIVCPMAPFGPDGRVWSEDPEDRLVLTESDLDLAARPSLLFAGSFPERLAAAAEKAGCRPVALNDMDEMAILNSVPTAEGALLIALERTTVTLHSSKALVLGYGRTGQTMARTLLALRARVTVIARRPAARARARADGCEALPLEELAGALTDARFVFNTIPALVLTADALERARPDVIIIDLASAPGGTDFEAARRLGLTAVLAPGLPGRVAPETAGGHLAEVVTRIALQSLAPVEVRPS